MSQKYAITIKDEENCEVVHMDVDLSAEEPEVAGERVVTALRTAEMKVAGPEPCSAESIVRYIAAQNDMTMEIAVKLVNKHRDLLERGETLGSLTHYVAGEIIEASDMSKDVDY